MEVDFILGSKHSRWILVIMHICIYFWAPSFCQSCDKSTIYTLRGHEKVEHVETFKTHGYFVWDSFLGSKHAFEAFNDCQKIYRAGLLTVQQSVRNCGNLSRIISTFDKVHKLTSGKFQDATFISPSTRYLIEKQKYLSTLFQNFGIYVKPQCNKVMITRYHGNGTHILSN